MAFKQPSSGPFKMMGSSPAKTHKPGHPPTDMSKLRSQQTRSRKGISEYQHFSDSNSQGDEPIVEGTHGGKKKKSALGIENPAELAELYKTTENPNE